MAVNVHGCLVRVDGRGVLIRGASGSGKTALAVSLLRAGAREGLKAALIADDRVVIERMGDRLVGSAPAPLQGLVELRGVGLLQLPVEGPNAIDLVADLTLTPERLPLQSFAEIEGISLRRLQLPPREAAHTADVILTVVLAGESAFVRTDV